MANIIDLSVFRKEPLTVKSLTGEIYTIDGNFSTEFYLYLYDAFNKLQTAQKEDYGAALEMMKAIALKIIELDHTKNVTIATVNEQFNDFNVLQILIAKTMEYAQEITNDPNSESPTSK